MMDRKYFFKSINQSKSIYKSKSIYQLKSINQNQPITFFQLINQFIKTNQSINQSFGQNCCFCLFRQTIRPFFAREEEHRFRHALRYLGRNHHQFQSQSQAGKRRETSWTKFHHQPGKAGNGLWIHWCHYRWVIHLGMSLSSWTKFHHQPGKAGNGLMGYGFIDVTIGDS